MKAWICEQRYVGVTTYLIEAETREEAERILSTQDVADKSVSSEVVRSWPPRVVRQDRVKR